MTLGDLKASMIEIAKTNIQLLAGSLVYGKVVKRKPLLKKFLDFNLYITFMLVKVISTVVPLYSTKKF